MVWDSGGARALAVIPTSFFSGGIGNRVWEFSAGDWSELSLSPEFHSVVGTAGFRELMCGCWADDRLLVASGGAGNGNYTNDVSELVGTAWASTVGYVASAFGGGYSPWRFGARGLWTGDQFFFYGGQYNTSSSTGPDTITAAPYLYDKGTFVLTSLPLTDPGVRTNFPMVWTGERVVLFGGQNTFGGTLLNDTWVLEAPTPLSSTKRPVTRSVTLPVRSPTSRPRAAARSPPCSAARVRSSRSQATTTVPSPPR
jgi:hypothetical protein